jgi:hypothetical protein
MMVTWDEYFDFFSEPLPHDRFNLFVITETSATFLDPVVNCFTRQTLPTVNRKYFFMNFFALSPFAVKQNVALR